MGPGGVFESLFTEDAELEDWIVEIIARQMLCNDNVIEILAFNELHNFRKLGDACNDIIGKNAKEFVKKEYFVNLSAQCVQRILTSNSFCLDEKEIMYAAKKWNDANPDSSESDRNLVMSVVRLHLIPRRELLEDVWPKKLFRPDNILQALLDQERNEINDIRYCGSRNENVATPDHGA